MTKVTWYICDVCGEGANVEADMSSITVAIANAVRKRELVHIHHEHVCTDCVTKLREVLQVDAQGKRLTPRPFSSRHRR